MAHVPTVKPASPSDPDVFISYHPTGPVTEAATRVAAALKTEGFAVFLAPGSIMGGRLWNEELKSALKSTRSLVVICTKEALDRPWVWVEVGNAWSRDIPIFPFALETIAASEIPGILNDFQWIFAYHVRFELGLNELIKCVKDVLK